MIMIKDNNLEFEIRRKIFHLCGLIFPLSYFFLSKITMSIGLTIITGITLYLDVSRHYNDKVKEMVDKILKNYQRKEEQSGEFTLSGSSYMMFGFLITCLFFPKGLVITAWLVLIISDCFAAILGVKYGSPLFNRKSYIGSASFFLSAVLVSIISYFFVGYNTSFLIITLVCLFCTLVEFFSKQININDNLLIPLTYVLSTFILSFVL
jgi:dolichol kinase